MNKKVLGIAAFTAAAFASSQAWSSEYLSRLQYDRLERYAAEHIDAERLITAPVIVVGRVESIEYKGIDKLAKRVDPRVLSSHEASVEVYLATVVVERG